MKLTPLDIQQQQFRTCLWGFDAKEVDAFLDALATDVEGLVRQNHALQDELKRKDGQLQEYAERERTLKDTMMTATRVTEDIKENARKESEIVIAQAETQAERIIQNAHARLLRIMEDTDELRRQKVEFESGLRSLISSHAKLLDVMAEKGGPVPTDSVTPLYGREEASDDENGATPEASKVLKMRESARAAVPDGPLLTPRGGDR